MYYRNFFKPIIIIISTIIAFYLYFLRSFNSTKNGYSIHLANSGFTFKEYLKGIDPYDDRIIRYFLNNHVFQPSAKSYNLANPNAKSFDLGEVSIIKKILNNQRNGFFIECGAFDGEISSNTLELERDFNWSGLLIEPHPLNVITLKNKNRKSWISNVCLSMNDAPSQADFLYTPSDLSLVKMGKHGDLESEYAKNLKYNFMKLQCFPLKTILAAMKITHIDYFSFDIEGGEKNILKTFPFDKVFIKTISIEHYYNWEKDQLKNFMFSKGFDYIDQTYGWGHSFDFIFAHRTLNYKGNILNGVQIYSDFYNEFCIYNFDSRVLDFELKLNICGGMQISQFFKTFFLTKEGVMKYFEGGCWAAEIGKENSKYSIFVKHCHEGNFESFDKWSYDKINKWIVHENNSFCLTSSMGKSKEQLDLTLTQCEENNEKQKWTIKLTPELID